MFFIKNVEEAGGKSSGRVLVAGLGKSGYYASLLASAKGYEVSAIDQGTSDELSTRKTELEKNGVSVELGFRKNELPECDFIIVSPGIFPRSDFGKVIFNSGKPVISEIEFASVFSNAKVIGITGTNGKTTVTELMTHVLKNSGLKAVAAGNIGTTFSEIVLSGISYEFIVLELSSFQLDYVHDFKPYIATILNITSDHVNWHGSMEAYAEAKFKIFKNMTDYSRVVINTTMEPFISSHNQVYEKSSRFSSDKDADFYVREGRIFYKGRFIGYCSQIETMLPGRHNVENFLAVMAMCYLAGLGVSSVFEWAKGFRLGNHRMELIAEKDNIRYVNDSKSTNPDSTIAALNTFGNHRNVCLIAGGLDKDMDFSPLLEFKDKIKKIFIIGKSTTKLENICGSVLDYTKFDSFENAVNSACDAAESGDVVLLSPGFASMDMFKNYIERGNSFKFLINRRIQRNEKK